MYLSTCKLMNLLLLNVIRKTDSISGERLSKEKAFYDAGLDGNKAD